MAVLCCYFPLQHPEEYWQRAPRAGWYLWRVDSCPEGAVALWSQRGFSLGFLLLTLLSIRDIKGWVKFSLSLDIVFCAALLTTNMSELISFISLSKPYFLSWFILLWARAQKKTITHICQESSWLNAPPLSPQLQSQPSYSLNLQSVLTQECIESFFSWVWFVYFGISLKAS